VTSAATHVSAAPAIARLAVGEDEVIAGVLTARGGSASRVTHMTSAGPSWLAPARTAMSQFRHGNRVIPAEVTV
jgi:hypothetical protein